MKTKLLKTALLTSLFSASILSGAIAAETVTVSGSTTVLPIMQKISESYMREDPNVAIELSGGGSGSGIKGLSDGLTQVAMSSRKIKPEESKIWYDKLWQNTVDLFRSMDIPVRTLECCSGDLADLKVKSVDVEAWSPRQQKYFEVGSCSNLGDAQARRLKIRVSGEKGKYFAHTLNNTVVAPPRMLIAFLENNLQADGSVRIPEVLRPYMGGMTEIRRKK